MFYLTTWQLFCEYAFSSNYTTFPSLMWNTLFRQQSYWLLKTLSSCSRGARGLWGGGGEPECGEGWPAEPLGPGGGGVGRHNQQETSRVPDRTRRTGQTTQAVSWQLGPFTCSHCFLFLIINYKIWEVITIHFFGFLPWRWSTLVPNICAPPHSHNRQPM